MDKKVAPRKIEMDKILVEASKLPYCKIDRDDFLRTQLRGKISEKQLNEALKYGTINAGIELAVLDKIADGVIKLETTKAVGLAAVAGFPGGLGMIVAVPADLAQYFSHVLRVAQKLAYVYGYTDILFDDNVQNTLIIFLGVMFGVQLAVAVLAKFAAANAAKIGMKVAAKPLTKIALYNIAKKVLSWIGIKLVKEGVGKAVGKAIPVAGAVVNGTLTAVSFSTSAKKLKKALSTFAAMTPEKLEKASAVADVVLSDFESLTADDKVLPMKDEDVIVSEDDM